jgi:pyridinium-3,5-biscarboxylic acid mononucleotide synthase
MNKQELIDLLKQVEKGELNVERAYETLKELPYTDLGHTKVDNHREIRTGYPEIIFCAGKTVGQVVEIIQLMDKKGTNILATRATAEMYAAVKSHFPSAQFHELSKIISIKKQETGKTSTYISVVTAGTSDIPVAEEAALTAEFFGNTVKRVFDVGVAGIHRLTDKIDEIRNARVIVVVAGMEGALPSVVGGLVDKPVIAVPTSIGYGANFGGLSALLGMLTSCASGISVVNIDNGFGAGYLAGMINKL